MSENPILMTQAEYARHRSKSPQYIGKLYKAGVLVMRGCMVDATASDRVLVVPDKLVPEVTALTDGRQVRDALKREMNALLKAVHSDIQYAR